MRPLILIPIAAALISGCVSNDPYASYAGSSARYERYEPSLIQLARIRAGGDAAHFDYQISDMDVMNYTDHVKSILRAKFTHARFARYTSATAQVLFGTAAGASAIFDGGTSTVATLALLSASMPELGNIFNAKARAETYQDAVRMIEDAEVDFLTEAGTPSSAVLTDSGIDLYRRVTTSIHVVEKAVVGQIPTLKEMQDATGQSPLRKRPSGRVISRIKPPGAAGRGIGIEHPVVVRKRDHSEAITTLPADARTAHEIQQNAIGLIPTIPAAKTAALVNEFKDGHPIGDTNPPATQLQIIISLTGDRDTLLRIERKMLE
jgi:hypothetical protein